MVTNAPNWTRVNDVLVFFGNFPGYLDEARLSRVVRYIPPPSANTNPPVAAAVGGGSAPAPGGGFNVSFSTATDQLYAVEYVSTLCTNEWQVLSNHIAGDGQALIILDSAVATNRFYRIRSWRP